MTNQIAEERIRIETTGEHASASVQTADGRWIRFHSARQPVLEADRFVEATLGSLPGGSPAVVIVIGAGLGYVIEAISRRAPDTKIIAIEPFPEMARAMLARRDWRAWTESGRLTLLVGPDYRGAAEVGPTLDQRAAASTSVVEHPVLGREFPQDTKRARSVADGILEGAKLNAEARRMFAGRYLLNTLRNLPALVDEADVESLRAAFIGTPAIIVAAGPSLDDNLAQLKTLQDRALVISVDTSLRPLRAAGIRPHLVVAVDPSDLNAKHLLGLHDTDASWLVCEGSLDPRVLPEFAGRVFTFKVSGHQPWPWLQTHGFDRGKLRAWGSVLTTAFDLALQAGCEPIVFAGADLAFTGGVHYCRGTMNEVASYYDAPTELRAEGFAQALRAQQRQTSMAVDIHGQQIVSTPLFTQFRDWIALRAEEAAPRRIVNATGAGILHGAAIVQGDLKTLALPEMAGGRDGIRARLADLWTSMRDARAETRQRLERMFTQDGDGLPIAAWMEFGGENASAEHIVACVDEGWHRAPAVVDQPRNLSRIPGWNATFVAGASGAPRPSVQWQESVDDGATWSNVAAATSPRFTTRVTEDLVASGRMFRAVFTNTHGSVTTAPARLSRAIAGAPHDFNGDGHADVLWRHYGTGLLSVWHMNRTALAGSGDLNQTECDTAWRIVGVADLDGDGRQEILWRNYAVGANRVWHLDGLTVTGVEPIVSEDDPAWRLVGIGDFNGDGKPDLVWRHVQSGANAVWFMDGLTRTGVAPLPPEPELAWSIAGVGDVNRDGKPDILWRNSVTGANTVWHMDGMTRMHCAALDAEPDTAWRIVSVADFSGSGGADVLWRHAATGANRIWTLDGVKVTGVHVLDPVAELNWVMCPEIGTA